VARLGELLIGRGLITQGQLDEALRAQVLYGGRLGTNLVDLDFITVDDLALALAQQFDLPPALTQHFERCDLDVQQMVPAQFAAAWLVIPIGRLADGTERVAVATAAPLPQPVILELAGFLRTTAENVVLAVACEIRLRFFLETSYGIARSNRFVRVRRTSSGRHRPIPQPEIADLGNPNVHPSTPMYWEQAPVQTTMPVPPPTPVVSKSRTQSIDVTFDLNGEASPHNRPGYRG